MKHKFTLVLLSVFVLSTSVVYAAFLTPVEIIDSTGDGLGNTLSNVRGTAVDSSGNVYVVGFASHNVFKITPGGVKTEIIDSTGDGAGNTLANASDVAVDSSGNVYVVGFGSNNVFKSQNTTEIGFQVTNGSLTVGAEGSIELPFATSAPGTKTAADTAFGNLPGCAGISDTGSGSVFLYVRQTSGNWAAVALTRDTLV